MRLEAYVRRRAGDAIPPSVVFILRADRRVSMVSSICGRHARHSARRLLLRIYRRPLLDLPELAPPAPPEERDRPMQEKLAMLGELGIHSWWR